MNFLVNLLFVSIFVTEYLGRQLGLLPSYLVLIPEMLSGVAMLIVIGRVVAGRAVTIDWRYGLFLVLYLFILMFGFLAQNVPTGAVIAGLRNYVKYAPFFLLPLVYPFTPRQLKTQLVCLLSLFAVQVPLAVYQRFVQFGDRLHTGDPIRGMATSSSTLSMLMLCGIAFVVTMYLRRKISMAAMLVTVALLFVPTTLNETKGTLVLLPFALLLPALFMPRGSKSFRKMIPILAVGCVAAIAYVSVYNQLIQNREYGYKLGEFLEQGHAEEYLYTGAADGEERWIGRIDSVVIAFDMLKEDPFALAFGLGAGNVSTSMAPAFDGYYSSYFERFGVSTTQVSHFLWEIGIVGLATYLLFYLFAFRDARLLSRERAGDYVMLGHVWAVVTVMMVFALMYKNIFNINEIAYSFWFFSGVVASKAIPLRRRAASAASHRVPTASAPRTEPLERPWPAGVQPLGR